MLSRLTDSLLFEVFRFVGAHNGDVRLTCSKFMECMMRHDEIVINGKNMKRMVHMLKRINLSNVKRVRIVDLRYLGEMKMYLPKFVNVREIEFIRLFKSGGYKCGAVECDKIIDILNVSANVEVISFVDCNVIYNDNVKFTNFKNIRIVKYVQCCFVFNNNENIMESIRKQFVSGIKFNEEEPHTYFVCNMNVAFEQSDDGSGSIVKSIEINNVDVFVSHDGNLGKYLDDEKNMERDYIEGITFNHFNNIKYVKQMHGLVRLKICHSNVINELYDQIACMRGLEELKLEYCSNLSNLYFVTYLNELRVLHVVKCNKISGNKIGVLCCMNKLVELNLTLCGRGLDIDFEFLNCLVNLEKLIIIGRGPIEGVVWSELGKLKELEVAYKELDENFCGFSSNLISLNLTGCEMNDENEGERFFTNMLNGVWLKYLNLSGCVWLTDEMIKSVEHRMRMLCDLNLYGCSRIKDIEFIGSLRDLEYLNILLIGTDGSESKCWDKLGKLKELGIYGYTLRSKDYYLNDDKFMFSIY